MGKKAQKKARSAQREKQVSAAPPKTVSQQSVPSTEAVDDVISAVKERKACAHLDKGIDLVKVSSKIGSLESLKCEVCREGVADRQTGKGRGKQGKKKGGGSVDSKSESKAIWVCLKCGYFSCGGVGFPTMPQSHAVRHAKQLRHPLVIQFENPNLRWCFPCSTLIPVEKSVENGEQKDVLHDIVKIIKMRSSKGASVDVEDVWFGNGTVTSEMKSENICSSDGKNGYVVRGLVNLGNTCFFNSVMQNLLAMDKLRDYFFNLDGSFGPLTVALKKLFIETNPEAGLRNVINPRSFFGSVCSKAPQFRGYQQHDSHELLRCLLDGLCTEEVSGRKQTKSPEEDGGSPNTAPTFVDKIFGGQLSSTVTCMECGHSSVVYEPFLDLSLPVPTKKSPSKKAQTTSRAKKSKPPPKRSGRVRSKVNKDSEPLLAQSASNPSTNGKYCSQVHSTVPVAENIVATLADSTSLQPSDRGTMAGIKDSSSQNISATEKSEYKESFVVEKAAVSLDDSTWLDYLGVDTMSIDDDMPSQSSDMSKDSGNRDVAQNDVSAQDALESTLQVHSKHMVEAATSKLSDDHNMASQSNDIPTVQIAGTKDDVHNVIVLKHSSESVTQFCSLESDVNVDYSGNSWEEENPSQVQDSKVLLLPYEEDTSSTGELLRGKGEVSSSAVACEQDSLDFDGFGDLFNEPEVVAEPSVSNNNTYGVNDGAETSLLVGNSSESDPEVVDNSDSSVSVESCFTYFTKPEYLSRDEHAWNCENCSKALQEERLRSRKKLQKLESRIAINGGEEIIPNPQVTSDKEIPSHTEARNLNNGNINGDVLGSSDESLVPHNVNADHELISMQTCQKAESKPVASALEEGKGDLHDALSEVPESSSLYKTSSQASFSCKHNDSRSVNEPCNGGCSIHKIQQRESQLLVKLHESEGNEDEEVDSEIVKVKRDATKRILFNKAPPILTIHLKRFSQDGRGRLSKLSGHVDFKDMIDLRPYMDPRCREKEKYMYRLIGVVEHSGTMRGGHYVAYVRSSKKKGTAEKENEAFVWYHASDVYVREASLEEVLRSEAYILFYEEI